MTMSHRTSPWEEWRPGQNPYRRTPFQVLGLSVTLKGRGPIKAAIRQRRQRVQSAPERFRLFGEPLDVARVNEAEDRILDPEARLYAELCTHRPRLSSSHLGKAQALLPRIMPPIPTPRPVIDPQRLARLVPSPVVRTFPPLIEW